MRRQGIRIFAFFESPALPRTRSSLLTISYRTGFPILYFLLQHDYNMIALDLGHSGAFPQLEDGIICKVGALT
jgi:hypothetical protein